MIHESANAIFAYLAVNIPTQYNFSPNYIILIYIILILALCKALLSNVIKEVLIRLGRRLIESTEEPFTFSKVYFNKQCFNGFWKTMFCYYFARNISSNVDYRVTSIAIPFQSIRC